MIRTSSQIENIYDDNGQNYKKARVQHINVFDDINFRDIVCRDNNEVIKEEDLMNTLSEDIIKCYRHSINKYNYKMIYKITSKMNLASNKMNYILNNFIQNMDSDIHISSVWEIIESSGGKDRIKIKIIVNENDKKMAIKKLTYELLKEKSNNNNKYSCYLKKYIN